MASKTLLIVLALALFAVAYSAYVETEQQEVDTEISVEDLQEYFTPMEKRGPKVGPCRFPNGKSCAICNLKIRNPKNMKRYIACNVGGGV